MLQIAVLREDKELVKSGLKKKNFKNLEIVEQVLGLDDQKRKVQQSQQDCQTKINALSKEVGNMMKSGNKDGAEQIKAEVAALKEQLNADSVQFEALEKEVYELLGQLPNLPHTSVPNGVSAEDNDVVLEKGAKPVLPKSAKPHWELVKEKDIIDFELGSKISGAGFPVYKGKGAKLQRALINFFLQEAEKQGYTEIQPPIVINEDSGFGTGQLPDKEGQMYFVGLDNLYLIPTAEVPITNLYRDVILKEDEFPIKNCGYTPCFRREAGSYGAHVRGLNRLHQFDKVEIVQIAHPEQSYKILEEMSLYVQSLLQKLELPYRVLRLCGGDMSFASALTYDMEVWSAAQERWLEVSSVSNFESFQSNRLKLRYKNAEGKSVLAHTLNGSALALPRIVASIIENNQDEHGNIKVPKVLVPYCGFEVI
jgi:seryl-tRNA synthetase